MPLNVLEQLGGWAGPKMVRRYIGVCSVDYHGANVVHAFLERRDVSGSVGQPLSALVKANGSGKGTESFENPHPRRRFPFEVQGEVSAAPMSLATTAACFS